MNSWNREELHRDVWQEPMSKLSKRYGVSGVMLGRVCRKLSIPVPGRGYTRQIKPFNFLGSCQVLPMGYPPGVDPAHFHLIAPYETNPKKWPAMSWIDQHSGKLFQISTAYSSRRTARVKTFGDVISGYAFHAEPKCADSEGNVCGKNTVGLLQRRHVKVDRIRFVGKESNLIEDVDSGRIHSPKDVYTEYLDPSRDEWVSKTLPAIRKVPYRILVEKTGLSRRALVNLRTGKTRPQRKSRILLANLVEGAGSRTQSGPRIRFR